MATPTRKARTLASGVLLLAMLLGLMAWRLWLPPAMQKERTPAPPPGEVLRGPASVYDADTLGVQGVRLRLAGVDAPEFTQNCGSTGREWSCGTAAVIALRQHLRGRRLECAVVGKDRFGRALATCTVGGEDLQGWLVLQGWAVVFGDDDMPNDYRREEAIAERKRVGLWRDRFERPSQWRHMRQRSD